MTKCTRTLIYIYTTFVYIQAPLHDLTASLQHTCTHTSYPSVLARPDAGYLRAGRLLMGVTGALGESLSTISATSLNERQPAGSIPAQC